MLQLHKESVSELRIIKPRQRRWLEELHSSPTEPYLLHRVGEQVGERMLDGGSAQRLSDNEPDMRQWYSGVKYQAGNDAEEHFRRLC